MKWLSLFLVVAQLTLLWLIASPVTNLMPTTLATVVACVVISLGIGIFLWAVICWQWGNLTAMPEPAQDGHLIDQGPYRYIRHPMYTALIVCGIGAAIGHGGAIKLFYLVLLCIILWAKLRREENLLTVAYPEYAEYMCRTKALIPLLV